MQSSIYKGDLQVKIKWIKSVGEAANNYSFNKTEAIGF